MYKPMYKQYDIITEVLMKQKVTRILSLLVLLALLTSLLGTAVFAAAPTVTVAVNSKERHTVCTALSADAKSYYTGQYSYANLKALSGVDSTDSYTATQNNPLYTKLHTLMDSTRNSTKVVYGGTGADALATYWHYTDAVGGTYGYNYFYADISSNDYGTNGMQREHVWPQSKASYFQLNGGADLHHLRPSIGGVNQSKSNRAFANLRNTDTAYSAYQVDNQDVIWVGTKDFDSVLEVRDNVKGDIARILLYVYVRWEQPNLYSDVASSNLPPLDSDDKSNSGDRIIEDRATLLQWCHDDPVDTWEMERNDLIQDVQGNRNVFIDYPELAWYLFGLTPPSDMQTPSGDAAGGGGSATVSAVSDNTAWGTVSVSGNVITAAPKEGYYAAGYTVTSGTASVRQDGNTFTVTATTDCVVRIHFAARAVAAVTFSVPNGVTQDALSGYVGDSVILPTPSGTPTADKYAYTFVGWTNGVVNNSGAAPTVYPAGSSYVLSDGGATLYAVYSYQVTASGNYVKVTGTHDDWSGEYLIVYEKGSRVMDGSRTSFLDPNNYKNVSITNAAISAAEADAYRFTVEKNGSAYSIRSASGCYIGKTANSAGIDVSTTTAYGNTISLDSNGNAVILSGGGAYLRYNKASNANYFRYFASENYGNQQPLALYVKETSGTRYTTVLEDKNDCAHTNQTTERTEPTCTAAGLSVITCNDCGEILSSTTLPATGHTCTVQTVAPTLTEQGYDLHTCTVCGHTYKDNYTDPLGTLVTVHFVVPNGVAAISPMTSGSAGITLPTPSGTPADTAHAYSFVGWTAAETAATTAKPEICAAGTNYKPSADCTLYALYSYIETSGGADNVYTLVAEAPEDWSGDYLIVNPDKTHAMTSTLNGGCFAAAAVTVSEENTVTDPTSDMIFAFKKESNGKYSILSDKGYLLIADNNTKAGGISEEPTDWFTITEKSGCWQVTSVNVSARCFAYYKNNTDFRTYASSTYKTGYLFKKGSATQTTYYLTLPACAHSDTVLQNATATTCTAAGYTGDRVCSACGTLVEAGTQIPALGHAWRAATAADGNDAYVAPTCTGTGLYYDICTRCGTQGELHEIPALGHSNYQYTDNGDGTHTKTCGVCSAVIAAAEAHAYVDGTCACGAKEQTGPTEVANMTVGTQLALNSDLSILFRVKNVSETVYDLSTAYLVVEKDQYPAGQEKYVKTTTMTEYSISGGRVVFTYAGITAAEMNDEIRATFYVKGLDGKLYCSPVKVTSICGYVRTALDSGTCTATLRTCLIDMLNYGTAAQIYFGRHTDGLANAEFEEYQQYATAELTSAVESVKDSIATGCTNNLVEKFSAKLDMNSSVGIIFTVTGTQKFTEDELANLKLVVKDESGKVLDTIEGSALTLDTRGRIVGSTFVLTARQMRTPVYTTLYKNGEIASNTFVYSIASYLIDVQTNMPGSTLESMIRAMIIYGDAADKSL